MVFFTKYHQLRDYSPLIDSSDLSRVRGPPPTSPCLKATLQHSAQCGPLLPLDFLYDWRRRPSIILLALHLMLRPACDDILQVGRQGLDDGGHVALQPLQDDVCHG